MEEDALPPPGRPNRVLLDLRAPLFEAMADVAFAIEEKCDRWPDTLQSQNIRSETPRIPRVMARGDSRVG